MKIRVAELGDAAAIAEIANQTIRDTLITFTTKERSTDSIKEDIAARRPAYLVADSGGEIVGFATYGPFRAGPGYDQTREHTIQLSSKARGQGLGRSLMSALENAARAEGVHALVAGISAVNLGALAFHSALDFVEVGRMPEVGFKWGKRLDLVLMQKILADERSIAPDSPEMGR